MRKKLCNSNGTNKSINFNKGRHRGIYDLLNCDPMLLFIFILMKLKVFRVTKKEALKMVKNNVRLY